MVHLHWRERPLTIAIEPLDSERVILLVNEQRTEIEWGATITIPAEG
jgi:hypothetical protein